MHDNFFSDRVKKVKDLFNQIGFAFTVIYWCIVPFIKYILAGWACPKNIVTYFSVFLLRYRNYYFYWLHAAQSVSLQIINFTNCPYLRVSWFRETQFVQTRFACTVICWCIMPFIEYILAQWLSLSEKIKLHIFQEILFGVFTALQWLLVLFFTSRSTISFSTEKIRILPTAGTSV